MTNGNSPKPEDVKREHACDHYNCKYCHNKARRGVKHICPIVRPKFTKQTPNLGVWHVELTDESEANCDKCIYKPNENKSCVVHKAQKTASRSIMSTLIHEKWIRGSHVRHQTFSPGCGQDKIPEEDRFPEDFQAKFPEILSGPLDFMFNPVRYKSQPSKKATAKFLEKSTSKMTAIEKSLHIIMKNRQLFMNMTLVMMGYRQLQAVHNALLNNNMKPRDYKSKDGKLTMLSLPGVDVRIVDGCHFFGVQNIKKLAQRYGMDAPMTLFPPKMRRNKYCKNQAEQPCPAVEMFYSVFDTPEEREEKENFVANFQGSWVLQEQIKKASDQATHIILTALWSYITFAYELQSDILTLPNSLPVAPAEGENKFTHPLSRGITTNTSFLFRIFKLLLMEKDALFAVDKEAKGIVQKSSKGEDEFVQLVMGSHPVSHKLWTAYHHPDGQRRFPGIIPDMYCGDCRAAW